MLADRRVIRLLAEFDILLDKLGLATMFPELAESQAKLIDSYGYALTRVTKMLGMLANTGALIDAANNVGKSKNKAEETTEADSEIAEELSPEADSELNNATAPEQPSAGEQLEQPAAGGQPEQQMI